MHALSSSYFIIVQLHINNIKTEPSRKMLLLTYNFQCSSEAIKVENSKTCFKTPAERNFYHGQLNKIAMQ